MLFYFAPMRGKRKSRHRNFGMRPVFRLLAVLDLLRAADDFFLQPYRWVKSLWPAAVARLGAGFSLLSSLLYRTPLPVLSSFPL